MTLKRISMWFINDGRLISFDGDDVEDLIRRYWRSNCTAELTRCRMIQSRYLYGPRFTSIQFHSVNLLIWIGNGVSTIFSCVYQVKWMARWCGLDECKSYCFSIELASVEQITKCRKILTMYKLIRYTNGHGVQIAVIQLLSKIGV